MAMSTNRDDRALQRAAREAAEAGREVDMEELLRSHESRKRWDFG